MKKTLFITMLTAALLGGKVYANTGFSGGTMKAYGVIANEGEDLLVFEDPNSKYEALSNVYGRYHDRKGRSVTIQGGIVQNAYGSFSEEDSNYSTIKMTGGTVMGALYGGNSLRAFCNANDNTVIVTGGWIGQQICGGEAGGEYQVSAGCNKVYITGLSAGCAPDVRGGWTSATIGSSYSNEIHLVGEGAAISIENERLEGHSMTLGLVRCGNGTDVNYNAVHIYGSGIRAKSVDLLQILNFYLADGLATAEAPMLSLSPSQGTKPFPDMANFTLNILADDVTDWGVLAGHTVTLVESQLAIQGFGDNPYKVVDVTKIGQSASQGILTLGNEGKELLLKVLRPGTEVLAPGESKQAGSATITALSQTEPGLLDNLSLNADTILGQGRAASLADGLKITSESDLLIESMTLTANNEIHVGDNTITLKDVTIKISGDVCTLANGIYTIDLKNLINCELEMENVLLDGSDLTLPEGFDLAKDAIAFDFGNDVSIKQATGLDMRLGNYWSPSVSTDDQGRVLFTKLVKTPEPTTGTLSLLALAGLCARRRRK